MLKIRLQGTTKDIKWFLKILARDKRFELVNPSDIFDNKGTKTYKRLYAEIYRDTEEKRNKNPRNTEKQSYEGYYGSGRVFGINGKQR